MPRFLGAVWGTCFAVGLVVALDKIASHAHQIGPVAGFLIGAGAAGLGIVAGWRP